MTGTNDKRPAFQQMLHDSSKNGFQFVIVYKFDRFARSRHDSAVNKATNYQTKINLILKTTL